MEDRTHTAADDFKQDNEAVEARIEEPRKWLRKALEAEKYGDFKAADICYDKYEKLLAEGRKL